jgi:hypothetical protein
MKMENFGRRFIFGEWKIFGLVKKKLDYGYKLLTLQQ